MSLCFRLEQFRFRVEFKVKFYILNYNEVRNLSILKKGHYNLKVEIFELQSRVWTGRCGYHEVFWFSTITSQCFSQPFTKSVKVNLHNSLLIITVY